LALVTRADTQRSPLATLQLPLLGDHQRLNAALAIAAVRALANQIQVSDETIWFGLAHVDWPGRFQLAKTDSGQTFLLDGAHNPAGAETLRAGFRKYFPEATPALIFGVLRDKDWLAMSQILAPLARCLLLVPVHSNRTATPEALQAACLQANPAAEVIACASLAEALQRAATHPVVVVTGSLYLVGETLELLELAPARAMGERGLNEWGAAVTAPNAYCSNSETKMV
jgi:dihydrofolate synthase/folylpolyglutamate synthase